MHSSQKQAPNGDFRHPHYLQNWFNEILCICEKFLWHGCLETHAVEQNYINVVVTNNRIDQQCGLFCHDYLTVTETQILHTKQKHQQAQNTTRFEPEHGNVSHS